MSAVEGYVLAARDITGNPVIDWDGDVHPSFESAVAEQRRANVGACCDDCTYQIYALVRA